MIPFASTRAAEWRRSLERWAYVLRFHRPEQLARRLADRAFGAALDRVSSRPLDVPTIRARRRPIPRGTIGTGDADDLADGRLRLLNLEANVGRPIDWELTHWPDAPELWRFHLHYHEYLASMAEGRPGGPAARRAWETVLDWIRHHPRPTTAHRRRAWHPYCISRRMAAWARLYFASPPPAPVEEPFRQSMAAQAEYLSTRLERDLGGNHLWENARALATAGAFFQGPQADRWRSIGLELLEQCIREQLSAAGEHFERSPMYQRDLADGLGNLAEWLREVEPPASQRLEEHGARMHAFLDALRHPDGGIPLFGDSTLDAAPDDRPPSDRAKDRSGWVGDYYVHREGDHLLLFDAGNVGPDDLPAHAHADLLGFELSLFGQRVLTDSGVFAYAGPKRQEYRRSAAHNVLVVDGEELADCWSSFRMGRRGHVVDRANGSGGGLEKGVWVRARHDAYAAGGRFVERLWLLADEGPWFSIHVVQGPRGASSDVREFLHWHPGLALDADARGATVHGLKAPVFFEIASEGVGLRQRLGGYSPRFHTEIPRPVLELRAKGRFPLIVAWGLSFRGGPCSPKVRLTDAGVEIRWRQDGRQHSAVLPRS